MTAKKRPGKYKGLPRGNKDKPVEWDLTNPFYEGFAERSEPGQGNKFFPASRSLWKRFKFERKSLKVQENIQKHKETIKHGDTTISLPGLQRKD